MNKALLTLLIIVSSVSVNAQSKNPFFNTTGGNAVFFNNTVGNRLSKTDDKVRYQLEDINYEVYAYEGEYGRWNPIFNEAGQNTILFERAHYGAEGWIVTKTVYTYDGLGQVLEQEVFRSEDPIDTVWLAKEKTQFYYAGLDLLDSTYTYAFENNNYELSERTKYFRNQLNQDTLVLKDKYEVSGFELSNKAEIIHIPDSNLVIENKYYNKAWIPGNVDWELNASTKTNMDVSSNSVTVIDFEADFSDGQIQPVYKAVHDLTMNGSISYSAYFEWQEDSLKWLKYAMLLNTFSALGENELCDMGQINNEEYFFDLSFSKTDRCIKSEYYWLDSLNSWELYGDFQFAYNDLQTNIYEQEISSFSIFPNPTSDYLQLTWEGNNKANIVIYNTFDQVVTSETINKNSKVDVSDLQPGLYYVQLLSKEQLIRTQSIVIQ